jgi:hypothetical protein
VSAATVKVGYPHILGDMAEKRGLKVEHTFDPVLREVTLRGDHPTIRAVLSQYGCDEASIRWHD